MSIVRTDGFWPECSYVALLSLVGEYDEDGLTLSTVPGTRNGYLANVTVYNDKKYVASLFQWQFHRALSLSILYLQIMFMH